MTQEIINLPNPTQNAGEPIIGTTTADVVSNLIVRTVDRSPKDRGTLRSAHIAGESVYYPNRQRLYDTYEDVLLDAFLRGIINKRISQVVNKKLVFHRNGEQVPGIDKLIRSRAFKGIMRQIMWSKFWGISGVEFQPGKQLAWKEIPRKHIKTKTQKITYEQTGLTDGISYTNLKNVWIIGDDNDLGILLICSYIILLKKGVISDWAQFIEIYGSPIMVLKYKGYDMSAKVAADNILKRMSSAARITIPEEMGLTFEDGKVSNGDGKLQNTFRQAANEELAILILGNTETSGHSGTGTGAKSKTHSEQQLEIIKDDMDDLIDLLNSDHFMSVLQQYGYDVSGGEFEFTGEVDIDFLEKKSKIDLAFIAAGLPVPHSYIYETYAIPEPKDGEAVFKAATPSEPDGDETEPPKPTRTKKKITAQAPSMAEISAMLDKKLSDFFAQAL